MESQIGSELGFGAALMFVKWTDGKDTAVIYKDVLAHLSSKQKEDAEQSIMKVTEQKEQERKGALGHLTTGGALSENMKASIKQHGGIYLPLKGYSMKYVYMSSIHKRKVRGQMKTGYIRESPHHVINQRDTCDKPAEHMDIAHTASGVHSTAVQGDEAGLLGPCGGPIEDVHSCRIRRNCDNGSKFWLLCLPWARAGWRRSFRRLEADVLEKSRTPLLVVP